MHINYIKLGIFTIIGLVIFIAAIYYLGTKNNIFDEQIRVTAEFNNASGIQEGGNVRLSGIKIGVVSEVEISSDSSVKVSMMIDAKDARFVKKDAMVWIGTDGLMGNKVVNISKGSRGVGSIENGDILIAKDEADIENIKNSILENTRNLESITGDLEVITKKLVSGEGLVGSLLFDTLLQVRMDRLMYSLEASGRNAVQMTNALKELSLGLREGKGVAGKLLSDENMAGDLEHIIDSLRVASNQISGMSKELNQFSRKLNNEGSTIDLLMTDTLAAQNLEKTIVEARKRAAELEVTIDVINNSWLLNLFSGNKKKRKKKEQEQNPG